METITIKTKTTNNITIGAVYAPLNNKIANADLHALTDGCPTKHYIIGGDLNAKHQNWNNLGKNRNEVILIKPRRSQ